ncbi:MAG: glycosyltransferase family 39 protein [Patescibacteria group bacterium]|nr:glycosyltransferase family 39 protein [Patescibacteria group bacterium]
MKQNIIKSNTFHKERLYRWYLPVVILFCLVFFFLSSIFPYWQKTHDFIKFSSPDENANYIFTNLYKESSGLSFYEEYNIVAEDIIRPRSYYSYKGGVKPVSFLGMVIIYGNLAKVFGSSIIPFLTPFFASMGLFFYYLLIKKLFGRKNALVSFFVLFSFPVLFYYSARSMFHNVLFLTFFIMSLYFLSLLFQKISPRKRLINNTGFKEEGDLGSKSIVSKFNKKEYYNQLFSYDFLYASLVGLFLGLAIGVRASELIWLAPAGLVFLISRWKKLSFFRLAVFLSFVFIALLPVFYYNQILYDSPFYGGYYEMNKSLENISSASGAIIRSFFTGHLSDAKNFVKSIFNTIFYFGFHPLQSFKMFYIYVAQMFWYLFIPFVFGFLYTIFFQKKIFKKIWPYGLAWLILSFILILYYGSWKFVDNPDPNSFTIGNSYTRYWLPIYIALIPFVSVFILNISKIFFFIKNKMVYRIINIIIPIALVIFIILTSFKFVYSGSEEGLNRYFQNLSGAKVEVEKVLSLTEENAVIITEYHDKFLFPERRVIVGRFDDDNMNRNYAKLTKYLPVYYYNFTLPEKDMEYLNNRRLKDFGLGIELFEGVNENFSLYKIIKINDL